LGWVQSCLRALVLAVSVAGLALVAASTVVASAPVKIVALGDSLTAGLGLPAEDSFPVRLERALRAKGHDANVINAGVSGDTASGGLSRLDWSVPNDTDAVILELGSNDALRGIDPKITREALSDIVRKLKERDIAVLLAGMLAPRNMGADYTQAFDAIYPELAEEYDVLLYPFFLEGVAAEPALNQGDGIHPNAEGVAIIVEGILPKVEALIAKVKARREE
jgi:acyl-CoA thioesterase-1